MSREQILAEIRTFAGVLELAPAPGSDLPEIAWGDHFFYYAPDGVTPKGEQPYATIVTKNYPGDELCELDRSDRWRLNIHVGRATFIELIGEEPNAEAAAIEYAATDVVLPHPVYRAQGWVSVTNPGEATYSRVVELLRGAHADAKRRRVRRGR